MDNVRSDFDDNLNYMYRSTNSTLYRNLCEYIIVLIIIIIIVHFSLLAIYFTFT